MLVVAGFLSPPSEFWIPLIVNLGSSFIVVAIIFAVTTALPDLPEVADGLENYNARNNGYPRPSDYPPNSDFIRQETDYQKGRLTNRGARSPRTQ